MRSASVDLAIASFCASLSLAVSLSGCNCGAASIPCASDLHCPRPLVCRDRVCQTAPDFAFDPELCAAEPTSEGCPCRNEAPVACYGGPAGTEGIGVCAAGSRVCRGGRWGACEGRVVPRPEVCNSVDDDCDGEVDDGVTNPCGTCGETCDRRAVPGSAIDVEGEGASGVERTPEGEITLTTRVASAPYLWVANDGEETVSKVDVETGHEVARYVAGPPQTVSNRPSRTVVDLFGDAYVVNRAFGGQGSITKFAGSPSACTDRNGNGRIDTSRDVDGDGYITQDEMLPWGADECVLWNAPVGAFDAWPRSIAVDMGDDDSPAGYVWVGTFYAGGGSGTGVAYRFRATDGALRGEVRLPRDFHPYGAAGDCRGLIWFQQSGDVGDLVAVDARRLEVVVGPSAPDGRIVRPRGPTGCRAAYGMTVDGRGRVWSAGNQCEDVWRYTPGLTDPTSGQWHRADVGNGRTIGIAVDLEGRVWLSHYRSDAEGGGAVSVVDGLSTPPRALRTVRLTDAETGRVASQPMGVGIGPGGDVWAITRANSCVRPTDSLPTGCAVRIRADGRTELHPVGDSPYTYSDFLGFVARNFTARRGVVRHPITMCRVLERWGSLSLRAAVPDGARVRVRVAAAVLPSELASARFSPWFVWEGTPLDVHRMLERGAGATRGQHLLVEVELGYADDVPPPPGELCPARGAPPRLAGIDVFASCTEPLE